MGTTDQPAPGRMCVTCGRQIPNDANVCPQCGHDYRATMAGPAPKKKTVMPVIGGVLILIAGIMGLAAGGILLAIDLDELDQYGLNVAGDMLEDIMTVCGIIFLILGILAVLGGLFGVMRKHWGLAILGGVVGLFVLGPWMLGSLFALIGLILVAVSKGEFE